MAISFENALGIHEKALILRNRRTEILANNIANAGSTTDSQIDYVSSGATRRPGPTTS